MKKISLKNLIALIIFIVIIALSTKVTATVTTEKGNTIGTVFGAEYADSTYTFPTEIKKVVSGKEIPLNTLDTYQGNITYDKIRDTVNRGEQLALGWRSLHISKYIRCIKHGAALGGNAWFTGSNHSIRSNYNSYMQAFAFINSYDDGTDWYNDINMEDTANTYYSHAYVQNTLWLYMAHKYNNLDDPLKIPQAKEWTTSSNGSWLAAKDCNWTSWEGSTYGKSYSLGEDGGKIYNDANGFIDYRSNCGTSLNLTLLNDDTELKIDYSFNNSNTFCRGARLEIYDGNTKKETIDVKTSGSQYNSTCTGSKTIDLYDNTYYNVDNITVKLIVLNTAAEMDYIKLHSEGNQELILVKNARRYEEIVTRTESKAINRKVNVSVNKHITGVGSFNTSTKRFTSEKSYTRSNYAESTKKNNPVYTEIGDVIEYTISIRNNSRRNVKLDFKDSFNSTYLELLYCNDITSLNNSLNSITISANGTKTLKIYLKVKNVKSNNTIIENKATISNYAVNNKSVINENTKTISSDFIIIRQYKISINKYINKINDTLQTNRNTNKNSTLYAEYRDIFEYKIEIKNIGNANIKTIKLEDSFNNDNGRVVIVSNGLVANTGWSAEFSKNNTTTTYNLSYSNGSGLAPNATTTITLKMQAVGLRKNPIENVNNAKITSLTNKNDIEIKNYLENGSNLEDSDKITLKGYSFGVNKEIVKITDAQKNDTNQKEYAETGDLVTYKITVTNNGDSVKYGNIKNIQINDYCSTTNLEYVSHTDANNWIKNGFTYSYKHNTEFTLNPGNSISFEITMKVIKESKTEIPITNTASIEYAYNIRGSAIQMIADPKSSTATFKLDTYNVELYKYINKTYSIDYGDARKNASDTEKYNKPAEVEKYDPIEYTFVLKNTSERTKLKNPVLVDEFPNGINFTTVKSANTTRNNNVEIKVDESKTKFTYNGILEPNEELTIVVNADIVKSNMYLPNIENVLRIEKLTNRNEIDTISEDILNYDKLLAKDYIRMKNLIIKGTVWLDSDRDGLIKNKVNKEESEQRLEGIEVVLREDYYEGNERKFIKRATTYTDSDGNYKFTPSSGEIIGLNPTFDKSNPELTNAMVEGKRKIDIGGKTFEEDNTGRVIKASGRDKETGNYNENSKYKRYFVEFYYNGVKYTQTVCSGDSKVKADGTYEFYYQLDSNAKELKTARQNFDDSLETIGYNKGMVEADKNKQVELSFTKDEHESTLNTDKGSKICAYAFGVAGDGDGFYQILKYDGNNESNVETDYLKFINLGLIEREKLDLELTKDLMYTQVRINGQTLDYEYGKIPPGSSYYKKDGDKTDGSNETKYNMYLYKSDYYYRYEMYKNEEVRKSRGENSELQLDLTYKIAITNSSTNGNTFVKLREIADHYTDKMEIKDESVYAVLGNTTINLNTNESSSYNNTDSYKFDGYRTRFIRGMDEVVLKNGETLEIYITYTVDKDYSEELELLKGQIYLGEKINVAQISAYSTYTDESCEKPKGLVDIDSNAGNVNKDAIKIDELDKYEDDTFRVRTDIRLKGNPSEDPPKDPEDPDNPPTDPDDPNNPNTPEKTNNERKISGLVFEDTRSEFIDAVKQYAGNGVFSNTDERHTGLVELFRNNGMTRATDEMGKVLQDLDIDTTLPEMTVELIEIVEIDGKIYEETLKYEDVEAALGENFANTIVQTNSDGEYTIESFIPGTYIVRFRYGDIYKDGTISESSLVHNGQDYKSTTYTLTANGKSVENETNNRAKYEALTNSDKSDEKIRGKRTSDARDNEYRRLEIMAESETMTNEETEFMKFTNYYNKDTNGKITKTEELEEFVKATNCFADTVAVTLGVEKYEDITERSEFTLRGMNKDYIGNTGKEEPKEKDYNSLTFNVKNIDFGVSYRPENFEKLTKKIKSIKLETSSGKVLVNLEYDMNGKVTKKEGLDKVQSIDTIGNMQGFRYINIDEELMQGTKVSIEYYMIAENIGEVDTVNEFLVEKNGPVAVVDTLKEKEEVMYSKLSESKGGKEEAINYSRIKDLLEASPYGEYKYGMFVGELYYTGSKGANDVTAGVIVERIIDWVDNDATFEAQNNSTNGKYWTATSEGELVKNNLITKEREKEENHYKDDKGRNYTSENKKNIAINLDTKENNETLIVPIYPKASLTSEKLKELEKIENDKGYYYEDIKDYKDFNKITSHIVLEINAVLSAGSDDSDMVYDNVAEVAQFNTITGRRTNFASTIGNLKLVEDGEDGKPKTPFEETQGEPDSSGTEVVSLIPPTGATVFRLFVIYNAKAIIGITAVLVIIFVAIKIRKYIIKRKNYLYK